MSVGVLTRYLYLPILLTLIALASLPLTADARTVVRSGETVSIAQDQLIEGDFYTAALLINLSGQVEEDWLAVGTEISLNGQVGADAFIVGSRVVINGTVGDDLRVIAETVEINEPVLGDVFVVGANVTIAPSATVTGDVTIIGGAAEVNGSVEGRILGWLETLRVDSAVSGDIDVTVIELTLGDDANVSGDVTYVSQTPLIRSQSATIVGEEVRNEPRVEETRPVLSTLLLPLLVLLFSAALWFLLSRRTLQRVANRALQPGIRSVILGILAILFVSLAIFILLVSMLGMLAGVAALATFMLFITLAVVALPAVLAQLVYSLFQKSVPPVSLLTLLVGTLLVGACALVPVVGPVILIGFTVLNFGALLDLLLRANR